MTDPRPRSSSVRVFIVVPAFNESQIIRQVIDDLGSRYSSIVVVDDGSNDGTHESLEGTGVHVLRHCLNRGQGAALQTGIQFSLQRGAEVIVTFDADGQHDVRDIDALLAPILRGDCDVVLGSRFLGRTVHMPVARRLILRAGVLFTRIVSQIRVSDVHNGLRAFSRRAALSLDITMDGMAHASEILEQVKAAGWRFKEIPVTIIYSPYSLAKGQSSWAAIRLGLAVILEKLRR